VPLPSEILYWEKIANKAVSEKHFLDNVYKRPEQIKRLLKYDFIYQNVLEIGVGNGVVAGALQLAIGAHWNYIGTELAPNFRKWADKMFHLNIVEADIRELPGDSYTRIIALDSLEHVRPDHRKEGYQKIAEVAAKDSLLFIHFSKERSYHDTEFDHPFGLKDFVMLEEAGFDLKSYENYLCKYPDGDLSYVFCVLKKC
jgi:methyltransferase family protein